MNRAVKKGRNHYTEAVDRLQTQLASLSGYHEQLVRQKAGLELGTGKLQGAGSFHAGLSFHTRLRGAVAILLYISPHSESSSVSSGDHTSMQL